MDRMKGGIGMDLNFTAGEIIFMTALWKWRLLSLLRRF